MTPVSSIIGLCGFSGTGKTRTCQSLIKDLESSGIGICGFISPAVFEESEKTAIKVRWLESNEEKVLMTLASASSQVTFGKWQVFPETFDWINLKVDDLQGCQAYFCDEIGPLEVLEGKGWIKALNIVDERCCTLSVITFRPTLRDFFSQRYPEMTIVDLEGDGVERQVSQLVKDIFGIG